jgi:hypothetical protein
MGDYYVKTKRYLKKNKKESGKHKGGLSARISAKTDVYAFGKQGTYCTGKYIR